ncbi:uncharacterized protein BDZ83DRAFT_49153 [Colletotrichum acutatum]|uniref:Uncharacterized protein n=1 Tax=Glomerella acutata TaxID=27357 RepID=A0AAD8XKY2_GLOAC|nr:uncharacterized protein BDZ83DRAFT_49153 [Colletotrichum acutatum]KAK1729267.1 hypothetical protein BDZ83DRAFT_49153 [Colletotrichum acutatum]
MLVTIILGKSWALVGLHQQGLARELGPGIGFQQWRNGGKMDGEQKKMVRFTTRVGWVSAECGAVGFGVLLAFGTCAVGRGGILGAMGRSCELDVDFAMLVLSISGSACLAWRCRAFLSATAWSMQTPMGIKG